MDPPIGQVLSRYPFLHFDLQEYLSSIKHAEQLQEDFKLFLHFLDARTPASMPEDEIKHRILDDLASNLSTDVPAYSALSKRRSLQQLPIIDKTIVTRQPRAFVNGSLPLGQLWCHSTFGTSGVPILVAYSAAFYFHQLLLAVPKIVARATRAVSAPETLSYAHITDASGVSRVLQYPVRSAAPAFRLIYDQSHRGSLSRLLDLLRELRPSALTSRPELYAAITSDDMMPRRLGHYRPQFVISSGSLLDKPLRRRLADVFQARVIDAYAMSEFGLIASQCPKERLHIDNTNHVAECLNEEGRPALGEGELTLSSTANRAMPLLRYRTGDQGKVSTAPCECGSPGQTLESLTGRRVPCFTLETGQLYCPTQFNGIFSRFPVFQFQIRQLGDKSLEVLIEPDPGVTDVDDLMTGISRHVQQCMPCPMRIKVASARFNYDNTKFLRYRVLS